jgi:hypothetical protein
MFTGAALAQTEDAYETSGDTPTVDLLDPSRFSINHSMSFGMASGTSSSLKSQSLYTTMLQYKFSQPVTLNLNFSLPIHSTFNDAQNLTADNLESADYFRNIPFDAHLTWKPADNLMMRISVVKQNEASMLNAYQNTPYRLLDTW